MYSKLRNNTPENVSLKRPFIDYYMTKKSEYSVFSIWHVPSDGCVQVIKCDDKHFVFKGTEDMVSEYRNYWFHIKGFFIGELLALVVCAIAGIIIQFVL